MIEVEIEDHDWNAALPDVAARVERAARAALLAAETDGDLVILLADDEAVRDLNARFRGRDQATNVLSFPAGEAAGAQPDVHLGDLALALGVCVREAEAQNKPLAHHLAHLVVHGVLHLLGRDHEADDEAEAMEAEERTILAEMGIPDPYRDED